MATVTLRPNANGAVNEFSQLTGAATHWEAVDEESADGNTTYVWEWTGAAIDERELFELPDPSIAGIISSVTVYANAEFSLDGNISGIYLTIRLSNTNYDGTRQDGISDVYTEYSEAWANSPDTSTTWTWAEINAMEVGTRQDTAGQVGSVSLTQVYVVVDYSPLITGSVTLSGVGTLAGIGVLILLGKATLAGIGSLSAIGARIFTAKATLSGIGTLIVQGTRKLIRRLATFTGRDLSDITTRDLSDDNDEFRELK